MSTNSKNSPNQESISMLDKNHENQSANNAGNNEVELQTFISPTTSSRQQRQKKSCGRLPLIVFSAALVIIFIGAVVILILLFLFVGDRPPLIQLPCLEVTGDFDTATKTFIFRGIPYAVPPVKDLRFKPTVPLPKNDSCVSENFHAVHNPPQCVQRDPNSGVISGSEDCLYLNIYSPAVDPLQLAPVMVYIHGGYLQFGNATTPGYCPDQHSSAKMGVVFVNIQYRVNAFGFLVTNADNGTGNYGFHDQIVALQWVRQHIAKFGGDPQQVTIFGQSSGGTSVLALMTSPKAKGLFQKAWMLSSSPILNKPLIKAKNDTQFFLKKVNCSTLKCLQSLKAEEVVNSLYPEWDVLQDSVDFPTVGILEPALAVVDSEIFNNTAPFDAWDKKQMQDISDVPLVIGTTAQEVDFEPAPGIAIKEWDYSLLQSYLSDRLSGFGLNYTYIVHHLYNFNTADVDPEYVFTTITSDVRVNCGNNILAAKAANALTSPVFRYVVTSFPSHAAHPLNFEFPAKYAFHSWDMYAFLDTFPMIMSDTRSSDHQLSKLVRDNMLYFVREGRPLAGQWESYPKSTALLGSHLTVNNTEYNRLQCQFWNDNGFFKYSWIN